jgi:CRISPR-associated protein Cmr4
MTGTEVAAHIKIDDNKKIVAKGALWYEESLPIETILAGLVWCDRIPGRDNSVRDSLLRCYCCNTLNLQIGGKATVGKGRIQCLFSGG